MRDAWLHPNIQQMRLDTQLSQTRAQGEALSVQGEGAEQLVAGVHRIT